MGNEGVEEAPSELTPGDHRSPGGVLYLRIIIRMRSLNRIIHKPHKAKPKIAWGNNVLRNEGLRDVPLIKATKTKAIPMAAPPNPNVAILAPMYLAAKANCILKIYILIILKAIY